MSEEFNLVSELALILIAAGIFTIISKALKQPLILGYIIAGFIVGPHLGLFPKITGSETVQQWSEIGIIFLLFGLGLEFSFKKLIKIGGSALTMAGIKFIGMFTLGILVGSAMSWTVMESVFLGGMLAMSSTTIVLKAYDDLGMKNRPHAPLVFGSLVFEDLIAVLLMVLLSTLAVSNRFAGGEMLMGLAKLAFFLILWFLVGIYVIPTFLGKASKYLSDEILLIVALGLCFGMVSLANLAGFSSALGAFVMGSLLSETLQGEHIARLTSSIKDMFGAIFFVSVGMMVDPKIIGQYWLTILILSVVVIAGVLFFSTSGAILAGQGLDKAVHSGFSLAMLGEFAFIIASLGCSMGVLRDFIYPVIVAVSVITTFTIPYLIKSGDAAYAFLSHRLPEKFVARIDAPLGQDRSNTKAAQNEWKKLIKAYILRIVLYGVILLAILLGSRLWLDGFIAKLLPSAWPKPVVDGITTIIVLAIMSPFLSGIALGGKDIASSSKKLLHERQTNFWPVLSMALFRILLAVAFVVSVFVSHFTLSYWAILLIVFTGFIVFYVGRREISRFSKVESRFMQNLNVKEEYSRRQAPVATSVSDKLAAYDVHTKQFIISPDSSFVGKTLRELPFRHISGANVVKIVRGHRVIIIPSGSEPVYPGDVLLVVGTTEQLKTFDSTMQENVNIDTVSPSEFELEKLTLTATSFLTGKTLREADMRSYGCMVISIISGDEIITNPSPDYRFKESDAVWIAGEKSACEWWN